jgi:hypothetical protein
MTIGRRLIYILWPSFIVAGIAEAVFFTLFDPMDLRLFDRDLGLSRLAVYSLGFFAFWAFAAGSSALTCFFQRSADELNRRRAGAVDASRDAGPGRALH